MKNIDKTGCKEISVNHFDVLKKDIVIGDDRALKEITVFLIVFGKHLYKRLENEIGNKNENQILIQSWDIACEIGGAFSEKLKAFGYVGFDANYLTWNHLASKYQENRLKSYISMVDSLLVTYGV